MRIVDVSTETDITVQSVLIMLCCSKWWCKNFYYVLNQISAIGSQSDRLHYITAWRTSPSVTWCLPHI